MALVRRRTCSFERALAWDWMSSLLEILTLFVCEQQGISQATQRYTLWLAFSSFEMLNATNAKARALGQCFLRQSGFDAILSE